MIYWALKILLGPIVKMIWIKEIDGLENIPKKWPYIIAANHSSYFDFISLVAIWPYRIYFLAGEVFFRKWWWYPLVQLTSQIKVDRYSKEKVGVEQKVFSILGKRKILGIFPEGTRSPDGKIGKTYTGIAKFALNSEALVVPIGIKGTYEVMSRHDKWPRFKKIIQIKVGNPLDFKKYYGKHDDKIILRQITDEIMKEVNILQT